jgi:diketogulonate reductase-like aldo/keto reductase
MRRHAFGAANGQAPVIGQGTWQIDSRDRAAAVAALRLGLDRGMTHVDTAEMYGEAEPIVGEAIAGRRDEVVLVSKVLPSNASFRGTLAACERSLARLRTDRLDVYLLHWPGNHPLDETIRAFEALQKDGKIRAWGLSNFDERGLQAALDIAGPGRIACNQVLYHLGQRAIEHAVLPWCEGHGVAVVAYSPFGHGDFPGSASQGGSVLASLAAGRGATPRQIALAFLTRRPSLLAIPKAASRPHVEENAAAGDIVLSDDDIGRIDAAFPLGRRPTSLPML